ncbi:7TM-DISM domain-containing protein [Amphritea sp.]|uniref:hybrid sensor histidine kinase/response regulator n=1 Tax=Amphritea sp. TaxID=1872502 RepID=UPI0035640A39
MIRFFLQSVLVVTLSFLSIILQAQERVLVLSDGARSFSAGHFLDFYEDPSAALTVERVSGSDITFSPSQRDMPRFGFTQSAIWARLQVRNDSSRSEWWLDAGQPRAESVILYQRIPGGWQEFRLGLAEPFDAHITDHRANLFNIIIPPGESRTLYLRVQSRTAISLPVTLWQPEAFSQSASYTSMLNGGIFSILLSVCIYSLLASLLGRNVLYLQFGLFVICAIIFSFSYKGFTHQYLNILSGDWSVRIIAISSSAQNLFYLMYIRSYLQSKYYAPRVDRLLLMQFVLIAIALGMSIWGEFRIAAQMIIVLSLFTCFVSLLASIFVGYRGYRPAWLLVLAQLILFPIVGISIAAILGGLKPMESETLIFLAITVVIPILAVSFNNRIKVLDEANKVAQERALKAKKNMVRELELQVAERTSKLQESRAQAEAASHAKGEFLAVMSHEMRTPMTSIIGAAELLNLSDTSDENKYLLKTIGSSCDHLLMLIDDVLDLSKIETDSFELKSEAFSLEQLLKDVVEMMSITAHERGLSLTLKVETLPEWCLGDPGRLRQIIINLIGNAIKYSDDGEITVRAELLESDDVLLPVYISVEDNGCGIASHLQAKIFEPFEQLDSSSVRRRGGAGLGLAICKRLVEVMNGTIGVESRVGQGSLFWFTVDLLPLGNDRELPRSCYKAAKPLRILLAEDTTVSKEVISLLLEREGHQVTAVASGEEAVCAFATERFDLVLMDLQMQGMSGFEAAGQIWQKSDLVCGEIPIFALTASSTLDMVERCRMAGFSALVGKPLCLQELYGAIANFTDIPVSTVDVEAPLVDQSLMDDYRRCLSADELAMMMNVVLKEVTEEEKKLDIAWNSKDYEALAAIAHKVAGMAATGCLNGLSSVALQLEVAAVDYDLDRASALIAEFKKIRMAL